jgi:hypothetical protein
VNVDRPITIVPKIIRVATAGLFLICEKYLSTCVFDSLIAEAPLAPNDLAQLTVIQSEVAVLLLNCSAFILIEPPPSRLALS